MLVSEPVHKTTKKGPSKTQKKNKSKKQQNHQSKIRVFQFPIQMLTMMKSSVN